MWWSAYFSKCKSSVNIKTRGREKSVKKNKEPTRFQCHAAFNTLDKVFLGRFRIFKWWKKYKHSSEKITITCVCNYRNQMHEWGEISLQMHQRATCTEATAGDHLHYKSQHLSAGYTAMYLAMKSGHKARQPRFVTMVMSHTGPSVDHQLLLLWQQPWLPIGCWRQYGCGFVLQWYRDESSGFNVCSRIDLIGGYHHAELWLFNIINS